MTIKKKRTIVSAIVALSAMAAMATSAFAATEAHRTPFNFTIPDRSYDYTSAVKKVDDLQTAYVKVESGNFLTDGSDRLYIRVCQNIKDSTGLYLSATETKWVNGPYEFLLNFTETPGVNGKYYRLSGYNGSDLGGLTASGIWEP